jgi:hypothetical protein
MVLTGRSSCWDFGFRLVFFAEPFAGMPIAILAVSAEQVEIIARGFPCIMRQWLLLLHRCACTLYLKKRT